MEEKSPVYLVMVTTNNNNKYYRMIPHGDTFEAEYGRVGASCQHASYSMSQWNKKYNEKIKKGYVDQTHLVQDLIQKEKPKGKDDYKEIENNEETTTSLKIEEEQITIKRFGALDSTLRFKVGKVDISSYLTQQGRSTEGN